jgi:hypothetical protein
MAADPLVYCLEQVTDYDQFERLAHDLMAINGYRNIEPLGGSKDKGRDAIHFDKNGNGKTTIFAYSVREDWRKKLSEDSKKIPQYQHACDQLVFLCTAHFTATERDEAHAYIKNKFGWEFELHGLERLRVLLATTCKEVIANHPQIFCSPFFPTAGGLSISPRYDHLVLDHLDADNTIAQWLTRRLTLAGFHVWCRNLAPLAGTSASESIKSLIKTRAFRFLPVLSPTAVGCPEMAARRALAHTTGEHRNPALVLPIYAGQVGKQCLEAETSRLEGIHFENGWAEGLKNLLTVLEAAQCPKNAGGQSNFVLQTFLPPNVLVNEPETLAANIFPVSTIPDQLKRWTCARPCNPDEIVDARRSWAFRKVAGDRFISFCQPPRDLIERFGLNFAGGAMWNDVVNMDGIRTRDIVTELLRRSLNAACGSKGLCYSSDRDFFYFPQQLVPRDQLDVVPLEGKNRRVGIVGERSFSAGRNKSRYRYHLAPTFSAVWNSDRYGIIVRPRIHITDLQGNLLLTRAAVARRKDIGGTWWNDDWFLRIQAVMQFLSMDGKIVVGSAADEMVAVDSTPRTWQVAVGINEVALQDAKANRDEIAKHDDPDDEASDETTNG